MSVKTFNGKLDRYNGVTVDSEIEKCDCEEFSNQLCASLQKWSEEKRRCIWFRVYIKDAAWVPMLAKEGFDFHHSRNSFVMMYKWLPTDSTSNLPPACHTNIGVGGIVFNDKNQILAVTEMHTEFLHWKLPGGYVERGEDLKDAAIREVKEETGIDSVFETLVTFRHAHDMMFENSDIYAVVCLKATSDIITKSDIEIKDCKWMDIEEFLNDPHVHDFNRFLVRQAMDLKQRKLKLNLNKSTLKVNKWSKEMTSLVLEDF